MRIKLSVKIFLAFLTVAVASIGMVLVSNHYYSKKNFESYIHFKGIKALAIFSDTVAELYKEHDNWQFINENPDTWAELIHDRWPHDAKLPEIDGMDAFIGTYASIATDIAQSALPIPDEYSPYPNVILYGLDHEMIAGKSGIKDNMYILPVRVNEEPVAWVALEFGPKVEHPLDKEFMRKESHVLFVIGSTVLLISIAIAFFLTRSLLAPIRRLSDAAEALGERHFKTRIPILSRDELGNLAKRFNTMAQKLETYERNQKQWLSDISHELRTPLSVLIGEIKALQDGVRESDAAALASLYDDAKHLTKIVSDLHFLSLSEAGIAPMERAVIKPVPVLSQAAYLFKNRMERNGMSIQVQLDSKTADLTMMGDRDRLIQLFNNLLENSLIHTNKPGELTVSQTRSNGCLHISFEDTGPGVPEDALPRLFDRLYRADPSRNRETGSSGLGLAICKTIVENHNGNITAQNSKKGGLKVDVLLPVSV